MQETQGNCRKNNFQETFREKQQEARKKHQNKQMEGTQKKQTRQLIFGPGSSV